MNQYAVLALMWVLWALNAFAVGWAVVKAVKLIRG